MIVSEAFYCRKGNIPDAVKLKDIETEDRRFKSGHLSAAIKADVSVTRQHSDCCYLSEGGAAILIPIKATQTFERRWSPLM